MLLMKDHPTYGRHYAFFNFYVALVKVENGP